MAVVEQASNEPPRADGAAWSPVRAVTGVAALSAIGMVLGYARDAALAAVFGATGATDAFFVATIVPAAVAAVVVSGALAPALLPVFTAALPDPRAAWALANAILTLALGALVLLSALVWLTAPALVRWLAPGLDPAAGALASDLTRLGAPLVSLLGLSALLGAMANGLGAFRLPAMSPVLVNGAGFVAIVALGGRAGVRMAVGGMIAGALAQVVAQVIALRRSGWRYAPSLAWRSAPVLQVVRLFAPLAAFVALAQVVPVVERIVASGFPPGALSLLTYAGKVFLVPGVVLSSSLAIVLFPRVAARHAAGEHAAVRATVASGVRATVLLTAPVAVWLAVNAQPVVRLAFERGRFSPEDTLDAARLLAWYTLAIVPSGIVLVLTRGLHAQRRMLLTLGIGVLTFGVYVAAAVVGARAVGVAGLPLALGVSQFFAVAGLGVAAFGRGAFRALTHPDTLRLAAATALGAPLAAGLAHASRALLDHGSPVALALALGGSLAIVAVTHLAIAAWLGLTGSHVYAAWARARWRSAIQTISR